MSKHTPGPWEWEYHPIYKDRVIALVESEAKATRQDGDVLLCSGSEGEAFGFVNEADRRLISAAPDLMEAAKNLSAIAGEIWLKISDEESGTLQQAFASLEAAIAKAEGQHEGDSRH